MILHIAAVGSKVGRAARHTVCNMADNMSGYTNCDMSPDARGDIGENIGHR